MTPTPVFRRVQIVLDTEISALFDHQVGSGDILFYDGRSSPSGNGFYFTCPIGGAWIGCLSPASNESSCPNSHELWYDGHKGVDYEYEDNWHTGGTCDRDRFANVTPVPVFAPARGKVALVQTNPPDQYNGNAVFIKHDLNDNNNFDDDKFRSAYLHFYSIESVIRPGEIVSKGQLIGYGGMTGLAWTPHLHFEVQRASDINFQNKWSVDPFGWQGAGSDPWPHENRWLWYLQTHLPMIIRS
ncbi:MAG: M23 family metallopeptidase [Chloroflexi bacterium]|nr:M23 family metallopeptidase [Chloroflexota bacterium]